MSERRPRSLTRGPRLLPGRIEGKVRRVNSAPFVVERLIRQVWFVNRHGDRIGQTASTLKKKIMESSAPALWKLLIEAGLLSMIVDKTTEPLVRFDLELVFKELRRWNFEP